MHEDDARRFPILTMLALGASMAVAATSQDDGAVRVPLGGPATVHDASPNAFGYPARVLHAKQRRAFAVGNSFFKHNWVAAPASTSGRDGLGPLFNARSCSSCHFKDGRGRAPRPDDGDTVTGFLIRLGVRAAHGSDEPHPVFGGQLQDRAIAGSGAEARVRITHEVVAGRYADGTPYELLRPVYAFDEIGYGADEHVFDAVGLGPRVAQQVIGLGLLEAIPDADLRAAADPDDADGDGISGRVHEIGTAEQPVVGRFGWKATQPTVRAQSAAAFNGDIGITSSLFPDESVTAVQRAAFEGELAASSARAGDSDATDSTIPAEPEIDDHKLDRVAFYTSTLAVPAQRDPDDPVVARGERSFEAFGCAACHTPVQATGGEAVVAGYEHATFRPYTDLLLHDLGEGLADGKHDGDALPSEWRTPPLWGIGLFETVNGHTNYLHDGRARDLAEAILWHGGEAERSREAFRHASRAEREALVRFLKSL